MESIDHEMQERAIELRRLTAEMLSAMTPQQRDRMLQVDLARARGSELNVRLLRSMTRFVLHARASMNEAEKQS